MAHEGNTKMSIVIVVYTRRTHEGHTMSTRRRIESTVRSNQSTKASGDLPMVYNFRPWEIQLLIGDMTTITKASNQKFREFQKNNQTVPEKIRKKITESEIVYKKNCH